MKVILRQDIENFGKTGDIVTVKDGYARNYLIPQKIAVTATTRNMRILEEDQKLMVKQLNKDHRKAEVMAKELENVSLTATVTVGEEDRLFGSVTAQIIADLLGIYTVTIKLHSEVDAKVRLWVVKE